MTRDEFMKELAYLLQDIQDEDKEDALQYYMDYFDEAGPDREADVVRELGSPCFHHPVRYSWESEGRRGIYGKRL